MDKARVQHLRLEGTVTLMSSLSHIQETVGPDAFFREETVIGEDGMPRRVGVYSGNAFRGHLRDLAAKYLLDHLDGATVPLEAFHLLFSGGSIGGDQKVDIEQARTFRRMIPMLSMWGGGVGNQILSGKMRIGKMYPLVRECQRILPERLRSPEAPEWREWTAEEFYTRRDDAKEENLRRYLLPEGGAGQLALEGEAASERPKKAAKEQHQQMRYTVEVLAAGAMLYQRIDILDATEIELGAFVSALWEFSKAPYLGGQSGKGHGLCRVDYQYSRPGEDDEPHEFMSVGDQVLKLSELAETAKERYDAFLLELHQRYLEDNGQALKALLGAAS